MECLLVEDWVAWVHNPIFNLQALDWFGNIVIVQWENATHAWRYTGTGMCIIK